MAQVMGRVVIVKSIVEKNSLFLDDCFLILKEGYVPHPRGIAQ